MSLLLVSKNRDFTSLHEALVHADPNLDVEIWPRVQNKERVTFAVCWDHPDQLFQHYPNLRAVSSLGAGVDHLLNDDSLSREIPVCRLITPSLQDQMKDYLIHAVMHYRLHYEKYRTNKEQAIWKQERTLPKKHCPIGIMGLGEMGASVSEFFAENHYEVYGWSRNLHELNEVETYAGPEGLKAFLQKTKVLINLLPLTSQTEGILDLDLFKLLKKPAYLINVGRGSHLVEEDLIYALDTGLLEGATLDVFETEPLPQSHSFWNRASIQITPHIAAITPSKEAAAVLIENYKRAMSGMELLYQADRDKGY